MKANRTSARRSKRSAKLLTHTFSAELSERLRERMRLTGLNADFYVTGPVEAMLENGARYDVEQLVFDSVAEAEECRDRVADAEGKPNFKLMVIAPYDNGHNQQGFKIAEGTR